MIRSQPRKRAIDFWNLIDEDDSSAISLVVEVPSDMASTDRWRRRQDGRAR